MTPNKVCCVTGETGDCIPRKELFGKSFCDQGVFKAPSSEWVGIDAWEAMSYKWTRMAIWFCDGENFQRIQSSTTKDEKLPSCESLTKDQLRSLVFDGNQNGRPWACYVTTSYKKHGTMVTPVNTRPFGIFRFESLTVDCSDNNRVKSIFTRLDSELRAGLWRSIMESLNCPTHLIKDIGIDRWNDFERWAKPIYKSPLYKFLCYILPSQEEMKGP